MSAGSGEPRPAATFDDALAAAEGVEGWLSDGQARVLWERARAVPPGGLVVEIGSFRGRSAIVMARALADGARLVAIDPHAGGDRGPRQIRGSAEEGEADHAAFHANLARTVVAGRVRHVRRPSLEALAEVGGEVDLLYVDGAHRLGPARADLVRWGARLRPGGTLLVHDAFSSVGVTLALLSSLVFGGRFVYAGRERSLAEYRRVGAALSPAERARNAARQLVQLPWFARNLALKAGLVARLRSGDWPY